MKILSEKETVIGMVNKILRYIYTKEEEKNKKKLAKQRLTKYMALHIIKR